MIIRQCRVLSFTCSCPAVSQHEMFQDAVDADDGVASDDVRLQRRGAVVFGTSRHKPSEYWIRTWLDVRILSSYIWSLTWLINS